jgi:hypothetical protein
MLARSNDDQAIAAQLCLQSVLVSSLPWQLLSSHSLRLQITAPRKPRFYLFPGTILEEHLK